MATAALLTLCLTLTAPASASANRLYVNFGDSVGAGFGASPGNSYYELYCAYLQASNIVDQCVNEAAGGATSSSALSSGMVQNVVNDIESSTDTPVVTVSLGGNDLLGTPGCAPITGTSCPFIQNMRTILNQLETALGTRAGPHTIQWLEYYNPNHDNPFGNASLDQGTAGLLLGGDFAYTGCASYQLNLIGLNDVINCIAKEKGATPVDAYVPFQLNCTNNDCFSDSLHPDDKGYGLIFDAFKTTPGSPVPSVPAPDGNWPYAVAPRNLTPPAVLGSPTPGTALTCSPGTWSGGGPISYAFGWSRDAAPIPGQNSADYLVQAADVGHALSCQVTASSPQGSASATSVSVTPFLPRPTISHLWETRHRFAPSRAHHRGGTVFSFQLDEAAEMKTVIALDSVGQRVGNKCRRSPRHPRHGRRCTLILPMGTLTRQEPPGLDRIVWDGHIRGRALRPGHYLATFVAINPAGASSPGLLRFTVLGG